VKRICNLRRVEGLKCKNGGLRAYLELDSEKQGSECKLYIRVWTMG
jgi:hypothetical protein